MRLFTAALVLLSGALAAPAAALCAAQNRGTRDLAYASLRAALVKDNVYFE